MITVLTVGKIKKGYMKDGESDYLKRISKFDKIRIIETDEKGDDQISAAAESDALKLLIPPQAYTVALDVGGKQMTSIKFAETMQSIYSVKSTNICFLIGGSRGLSAELSESADMRISFSMMTFPHQLFRVILLEQIYRAFKINNNQTYHK